MYPKGQIPPKGKGGNGSPKGGGKGGMKGGMKGGKCK